MFGFGLEDIEAKINELKVKQNKDRDDLNRLIKELSRFKKKDFYAIFPKVREEEASKYWVLLRLQLKLFNEKSIDIKSFSELLKRQIKTKLSNQTRLALKSNAKHSEQLEANRLWNEQNFLRSILEYKSLINTFCNINTGKIFQEINDIFCNNAQEQEGQLNKETTRQQYLYFSKLIENIVQKINSLQFNDFDLKRLENRAEQEREKEQQYDNLMPSFEEVEIDEEQPENKEQQENEIEEPKENKEYEEEGQKIDNVKSNKKVSTNLANVKKALESGELSKIDYEKYLQEYLKLTKKEEIDYEKYLQEYLKPSELEKKYLADNKAVADQWKQLKKYRGWKPKKHCGNRINSYEHHWLHIYNNKVEQKHIEQDKGKF